MFVAFYPIIIVIYYNSIIVTIIIGYNATNTGNNVASLHYNNSNRTDVAMPAGCCDDAEARRKTEKNGQPFNGTNFILLQFKEQVSLLILRLEKQRSLNCLS